jgi:hypothetical protein
MQPARHKLGATVATGSLLRKIVGKSVKKIIKGRKGKGKRGKK